jgi:hypothetical protein
LDLTNIFLDSFLKGGFSTEKKAINLMTLAGLRLMAWKVSQRGKPL